MITLVLLRHGQTDWNLYHRYQGLTDIPLNTTGEQQAREANKLLLPYHFDVVYSSDLDRVKTTARLALKGIFPFDEIRYDRRLRERSFGVYEGGPYDFEKLPREYQVGITADPENFKFPEGESLIDVEKRVHPFYDEIRAKHENETVLIVAHGSLLSMLLFSIENKPVNAKTRVKVKNAEPMILKL